MRNTIVRSLLMTVTLALLCGIVFAAQEPGSVEPLAQPINNLGNQVGYHGSQVAAGFRYLGNCLLGSSVIIAIALMVARRRQ